MKPLVVVAAALLRDDQGRVLLTQRRPGSHMGSRWEFPGGKVEPGETPERTLARELLEEVGVEITDPRPWAFVTHSYKTFNLLMPVFSCVIRSGVPRPLEVAALGWFRPGEMMALSFPPADQPLVARLLQEEEVERNARSSVDRRQP
ncbi:MAG: (deoxy)nucleoside triphosphate pyrophosphohydrolase [Magnetococcales bacterium]|nr:(deoxy)nucleoside triphosphate pyrophosphohydrolase [Magnetococcales bacterium]